MPTEADTRCEIAFRVGQRLPVIAQADVERQVVRKVDTVLNEPGIEPLTKFIVADPEVDGLRVILNIGKCQLAEWRGCRVQECERSKDSRTRLASRAAGSVVDNAAAEAKIVH